MYNGPNKLRKTFNKIATGVIGLYVLIGNGYNITSKTGHPSVDIATGRSTPTALEQMLMDSVKENKK